jgi:hypothetical protein
MFSFYLKKVVFRFTLKRKTIYIYIYIYIYIELLQSIFVVVHDEKDYVLLIIHELYMRTKQNIRKRTNIHLHHYKN